MKPPRLDFKKISVMFNLLTVALLAGCLVLTPDGRRTGPPSGVVEMDQNTDPRFFLRNQQGAIGFLKRAGNNVMLNGKKVMGDIRIQNGAHVSTGVASAAIIEFFPSIDSDCMIEVRNFRKGRLYGLAQQCGHIVVTDQGVMETSRWKASYHAETQAAGVTIFTAINGQASVWLHSNPSNVVVVPDYHQVRLSYNQISAPRRVTPGEVESMTRWRKNFQRYKTTVIEPDLDRSRPFLLYREGRRVRPPTEDRVKPTLEDGQLR
jgi:hypothetical protein